MVVNWNEMLGKMIDRMIVLATDQTFDVIFSSSYIFCTFDATRSLITIPQKFPIFFCNCKSIPATTLRTVKPIRCIIHRFILFYKFLYIHLVFLSRGLPLGKFLAFITAFNFRQPPKTKKPPPTKSRWGQGEATSMYIRQKNY